MGAWGPGSVENDTAADWVWELDDADDWRFIESALADGRPGAPGSADPDLVDIGVAAAEVVAHALGRPTQADVYTESIGSFVRRQPLPDPSLVARAREFLIEVTRADAHAGLVDDELVDDEGEFEEVRVARLRLLDALSQSD